MRLTIRKLEIDLAAGFGRHWHGGDPFRTQYSNALSMSFPVGEQYFIDSVRRAAASLPADPCHDALRRDIADFIGQEATHRHLHALYNRELTRQGLVNRWERWVEWRIRRSGWMHPLSHLAMTCAYEHLTATFADGTLRHASWFDGAEPKMQMLWRWHAAEETEHRAVAFQLYQALGGGWARRCGWYGYALLMFAIEATLQTTLNLWRDGTLLRPRVWASAARFLFGRQGLAWVTALPLLRYLRPGFHPEQEHANPPAASLAADWLRANGEHWRAVR